ncbi:hypothetical protein MTR_4g032170 [Medicago truncatula]|uniref:Uncharacterized protein n=1 Tax=Medicago truncatula TaxID=3880 RepID=G7JN45_MEDTR|nr:hypothetical protein MTR_4g032170 [Medicago truncatula]
MVGDPINGKLKVGGSMDGGGSDTILEIVVGLNIKKRATRCTRAPAYAGSGKGFRHLVYCTQSYPVLHKRLFSGLEPVTFQSHDNNFTSCAKVTPLWLDLT